MLRFLLLAMLPIVALCNEASVPTNREQILAYLETYAKPCILRDQNCPPNNPSFQYSNFAPTMRQLIAYRLPAQCRCDTATETCNRACYYAYLLKTYRMGAIAGKTDPTEIANADRQITELFETRYKPCVLENKNCELAGGITYSMISSQVAEAVRMYSLPDECDYEVESEAALRTCYYAYIKRVTLQAYPSKK